jgi:hypothetical protein
MSRLLAQHGGNPSTVISLTGDRQIPVSSVVSVVLRSIFATQSRDLTIPREHGNRDDRYGVF